MSSLVEDHTKSFSDKKRSSTIQHLKQEEELSIIVKYAFLKEMPLGERRKAAEKPLYLARYE